MAERELSAGEGDNFLMGFLGALFGGGSKKKAPPLQPFVPAAAAPAAKKDKRKVAQRLSLIATGPQGIQSTAPVGRRKLLGN